jgi:hypothetical protein
MRAKQELVPQVTKKNPTDYVISFWYKGKRYRFSNGRPINIDISPNTYPNKIRHRQAEVFCSAYTMAIRDGWLPLDSDAKTITTIDYIAKKNAS